MADNNNKPAPEDDPANDTRSAWEVFGEDEGLQPKELSPEEYSAQMDKDEAKFQLSQKRAAFFRDLAKVVPGFRKAHNDADNASKPSILMVAAGPGQQLHQIPGPTAAGGLGFDTVYFTDGSPELVDLALAEARRIFADAQGFGSSLRAEESAHPRLRFSNRPKDAGRQAVVFKISALKQQAGQEPEEHKEQAPAAAEVGPLTWAGLTLVFLQAWSSELSQVFAGERGSIDAIADVFGLCSFAKPEEFAKDLKRCREQLGAACLGFLEHGILGGDTPPRTSEPVKKSLRKLRKEHWLEHACDMARDMKDLVGREVCGGDFTVTQLPRTPSFFWFVHPAVPAEL